MTDKNQKDDIVDVLYSTDHLINNSLLSPNKEPQEEIGMEHFGLLVKLVVIAIAIVAFAIYSHNEDKRQEAAYRQMWREIYDGYSSDSWKHSKYYGSGSSSSTTYTKPAESSTTTKKSTGTTPKRNTYRKSTTEESDSLNVKDYRDPEDFYYDNYDDFFEYEDAEEYYYEHGGY